MYWKCKGFCELEEITLMGMAGDPVAIAKAIVDPSLPRLKNSQQFMLKLRDVLQVFAVSSPSSTCLILVTLNTSVHHPILQLEGES